MYAAIRPTVSFFAIIQYFAASYLSENVELNCVCMGDTNLQRLVLIQNQSDPGFGSGSVSRYLD